MCGRFMLSASPEVLGELAEFAGVIWPILAPRYNIAPGQSVVAVRREATRGVASAVLLRWGLVPFWAKDPKIGNRLINARSETVATKPSFRAAYKYRRCLVPADGFYEWQKGPAGRGKQPFCIRSQGGRPLILAGLWESWSGDGQVVDSCTLLTTQPNAFMRPIHDRMPVILQGEGCRRWLDPEAVRPGDLDDILVPCADDLLTAFPVGPHVNNPRVDDPRCAEPVLS